MPRKTRNDRRERSVPLEGQIPLYGVGVTGDKIMKDAMEWRSRNLRAWTLMKHKAEERFEQGRRTSIAELAEDARYSMRLEGYTDGFRINNTTRAGLARLMIQECPHLASIIETRSSKADWA